MGINSPYIVIQRIVQDMFQPNHMIMYYWLLLIIVVPRYDSAKINKFMEM